MDRVDTLEVRRLVLVDSNGRARGELACTEDGLAQLVLRDGHGTVRAVLAVPALERIDPHLGGTPGSVLLLYDANARVRASLAVTEAELSLPFISTDAAGSSTLQSTDPGRRSFAVLALSDEDENPRLKLSVTSKEGPTAIGIDRADGSPMAQLTSDMKGEDSALVMYDSRGTPCIHAGVSAAGQPHYRSWDRRPFWRRLFFSGKP